MMRERLSHILAIAGATFREALRMRLFALLALASLASLALGFSFRDFNFGASELKFIADFGFGAITLGGSILAVALTTQLVYGEFEHRSAMTLLARPVRRSSFVWGKLLGSLLPLACFVGAIGAALVIALWVREGQLSHELGGEVEAMRLNYGHILAYCGLQFFRLGILAAVAVVFCSYATSSVFALFMSFGVWLIGQLQGAYAEVWARGDSLAARAGAYALKIAVPDFQLFDIGEAALSAAPLEWGAVLRLVAYALGYMGLYGLVASFFLKHREF